MRAEISRSSVFLSRTKLPCAFFTLTQTVGGKKIKRTYHKERKYETRVQRQIYNHIVKEDMDRLDTQNKPCVKQINLVCPSNSLSGLRRLWSGLTAHLRVNHCATDPALRADCVFSGCAKGREVVYRESRGGISQPRGSPLLSKQSPTVFWEARYCCVNRTVCRDWPDSNVDFLYRNQCIIMHISISVWP